MRHSTATIVISFDTVLTNTKKSKKPYHEELHRGIIHEILHLCGINDKEPDEPNKRKTPKTTR